MSDPRDEDPADAFYIPPACRRTAETEPERRRSMFMSSPRPRVVFAAGAEAGTAEASSSKTGKTAKAPVKVNGSKASAKAAKPAKTAKPAKAAAAKKAAKPAKAKAKATRNVDPAKLDQFGFRKGTKKSLAAAMYATKKGATLGEIEEKLESTQFNLLGEVEKKGWKIEKKQEKGDGTRATTRYKILPK